MIDKANSLTDRRGVAYRKTRETSVKAEIYLDRAEASEISTGAPFFDHMLDQIARHGRFQIKLVAEGDLEIDAHHTIEDCGYALGLAVSDALGDRKGVYRYGYAYAPLDEALSRAVTDLSGRPFSSFNAEFSKGHVGNIVLELFDEFFKALAQGAGLAVHIDCLRGRNDHHKIESVFKAFAQSLRKAVALDPRCEGAPSTKGALGGALGMSD